MNVRRVLSAVSLLLPPLVIGASWLHWRDRLPDRVASHWSDAGAGPDDTLATAAALTGTATVAVGAALAGVVVAAVGMRSAAARRGVLAIAGFLGGMAAGAWLVPTGLTVRAGSPDDAVLGAWGLALVAGGAYAVVPYLLAPPGSAPVRPVPAGRVPLGPTETGAWITTITAPMFAWVGAGIVVMGIVLNASMLASGLRFGALGVTPIVLGGLVVALFVRMRVTADWRGLRVESVLLPIPLKRIRLDRIAEVAAIDVDPWEWGGWGYRWTPGRTAIVLRQGRGLAVTATDGTRFAVTLDEPEVPAALLDALRSGHAPG